MQAPPELLLLRLSILEDGWTSPIVVRPPTGKGDKVTYEITDGYHRWLVSKDPDVFAMTGGMVPVCILVSDPASQRLSTIRHNRARGTHHVVKMADIVAELANDLHLDTKEIGRRLGMEREEVQRLLDRGSLLKTDGEFGPAWAPAAKHGDGRK